MKAAYVDTSCLVAVAFEEEEGAQVLAEISAHDVLLGCNLTEAELRAAGAREDAPEIDDFLDDLTIVFPSRRLGPELDRALGAGYLRGADLLHVATALYVAESPADIAFLTLDDAQRDVAATLGFETPI